MYSVSFFTLTMCKLNIKKTNIDSGFFVIIKGFKNLIFEKLSSEKYKQENKKHEIHLKIYHLFVHLFIYSTNKPGTVLSTGDPLVSKKKSHSEDLQSMGERE